MSVVSRLGNQLKSPQTSQALKAQWQQHEVQIKRMQVQIKLNISSHTDLHSYTAVYSSVAQLEPPFLRQFRSRFFWSVGNFREAKKKSHVLVISMKSFHFIKTNMIPKIFLLITNFFFSIWSRCRPHLAEVGVSSGTSDARSRQVCGGSATLVTTALMCLIDII